MLWQVALAIVLGIVAGILTGKQTQILGTTYYTIFSFFGQLFLNGLTLLVIPLVASAIINGISNMGKDQSFKRLGSKTFFFYILTTFLAILTGLAFVNLIKPGLYHHLTGAEAAVHIPELSSNHIEVLGEVCLKLIPPNIFEAASTGNMLGIIFFSLLFGFALSRVENEVSDVLSRVIKIVFQTMMRMTHYIMKVMPLGVFFLVAKAFSTGGVEMIKGILLFFLAVLAGLLTFMFVILPLLFKIRGLSPWRHLQAISPALITAFSTSSSAATLPVTIDCVEKRAGVSNRICSFVVPLGTSVNLSGSALYECVAALFIAQVYGIELTFFHQLTIVILSLITSMGVAAIPSASLVAILIILKAVGLPAEGLALILPVDRILDMCRTTVNVFSDASCAVLVAHSEGEKVLKKL